MVDFVVAAVAVTYFLAGNGPTACSAFTVRQLGPPSLGVPAPIIPSLPRAGPTSSSTRRSWTSSRLYETKEASSPSGSDGDVAEQRNNDKRLHGARAHEASSANEALPSDVVPVTPASLASAHSHAEQHQPPDSSDEKKKKKKQNRQEEEVKRPPSQKRRGMELSWCGRHSCKASGIREKVVGEHNHIEFEGPATGQVMYEWTDAPLEEDRRDDEDSTTDAAGQNADLEQKAAPPSVLLLVKRDDDHLLKVAAEAVQNLTALDVQVFLHPALSAKIKHYFGVDDERIKLFDPQPVPGFGGSHIPLDAAGVPWEGDKSSDLELHGNHPPSGDGDGDVDPGPDLICTLGGDGLLMHASMLFPGPVPPILCIAGGSMGFLTPFSKEEMVDAIATALGIAEDEEEEEGSIDGDVGPANRFFSHGELSSVGIRPRMSPALTDRGGTKWSGSATHTDYYDESYLQPKFSFGAYNRICLSMRMRLDCRIINREGVVRARFNVLNEVVIDRGSSPYLANLECFCDDVHLTTVQADGVIFSTPTGSTAYSMAAGGSVVHPAVPAILVTPICPHVLSFRSMVFPDHVVLRCYVPDDARSDACVAFDGKYRRELHRGDSVQIQMSAHPVPTINRMDHSSDWLNSLKRNFNFNTRVRQSPL